MRVLWCLMVIIDDMHMCEYDTIWNKIHFFELFLFAGNIFNLFIYRFILMRGIEKGKNLFIKNPPNFNISDNKKIVLINDE